MTSRTESGRFATASTGLEPRSNDGWLLHEWIDTGATVDLASLHCGIKIAEIYTKVAFET